LTSAEVTGYLDAAVERQAPTVQVLQSPDFAEMDNPPSPEDAQLMVDKYGVDAVVWIAVRFQNQNLPTLNEYMRNLTLSAAARMWIYDGTTQSVLVDEPLSVVRQTPMSSSVGIGGQAAAVRALKFSCGTELASSLVHAAQDARNRSKVKAWSATSPKVSAPENKNLAEFQAAFTAYQKVVSESDFAGAANAQVRARDAWKNLTEDERIEVETQYPGVREWIGK